MSNLPTPPTEDSRSTSSRKAPKTSSKPLGRASKRATMSSHEHGAVVIDGRHKRVWKACERCRMKKTKCDGESPCKRCKDDGLVCTAGSRKKTEFKQLPRGYAEVLENTQYALIATVQKLYTMLRNNESWELGEPEMNDRGQPVIHDIASKLGCIRPSPDLPYAFPEGAEDFAELQAQLQAARSEAGSEDMKHGKFSEGSCSGSPALERTDRASSTESDHSIISKDYNQTLYSQQRQAAAKNLSLASSKVARPAAINRASNPCYDEESYSGRQSFDTGASMPSPVYTEFHNESPMFRNSSPFSPWLGNDEFLGQALDLNAQYMKQQQFNIPCPSQLTSQGLDGDMLKNLQMNDGLNLVNGTIRPGMLDCNTGYDLSEPLDSIMYGAEYDQMGMV